MLRFAVYNSSKKGYHRRHALSEVQPPSQWKEVSAPDVDAKTAQIIRDRNRAVAAATAAVRQQSFSQRLAARGYTPIRAASMDNNVRCGRGDGVSLAAIQRAQLRSIKSKQERARNKDHKHKSDAFRPMESPKVFSDKMDQKEALEPMGPMDGAKGTKIVKLAQMVPYQTSSGSIAFRRTVRLVDADSMK